jgi:hypothetical protein
MVAVVLLAQVVQPQQVGLLEQQTLAQEAELAVVAVVMQLVQQQMLALEALVELLAVVVEVVVMCQMGLINLQALAVLAGLVR